MFFDLAIPLFEKSDQLKTIHFIREIYKKESSDATTYLRNNQIQRRTSILRLFFSEKKVKRHRAIKNNCKEFFENNGKMLPVNGTLGHVRGADVIPKSL